MFGMSPSVWLSGHPQLRPGKGGGVVVHARSDVAERVDHAPLADLDDERDVVPDGHVLEGEVAALVGRRADDRRRVPAWNSRRSWRPAGAAAAWCSARRPRRCREEFSPPGRRPCRQRGGHARRARRLLALEVRARGTGHAWDAGIAGWVPESHDAAATTPAPAVRVFGARPVRLRGAAGRGRERQESQGRSREKGQRARLSVSHGKTLQGWERAARARVRPRLASR